MFSVGPDVLSVGITVQSDDPVSVELVTEDGELVTSVFDRAMTTGTGSTYVDPGSRGGTRRLRVSGDSNWRLGVSQPDISEVQFPPLNRGRGEGWTALGNVRIGEGELLSLSVTAERAPVVMAGYTDDGSSLPDVFELNNPVNEFVQTMPEAYRPLQNAFLAMETPGEWSFRILTE